MSEIIGVPFEYHKLLKAFAVDIVNFFGSPPHLYIATAEKAMHSLEEASLLFRNIIQQRRQKPQNDLISVFIAAEAEGNVLHEDEILATCLMMIFAGFETTTNLIGNGLLTLMTYPEQQTHLRNDMSLMKSAISEMLRFESPVQRLSRMSLCDFTLEGKEIKKGDLMFLMASSANRDPQCFNNPDYFIIDRNPKKHLAFGHSIHTCPGNTLANLEADILFTELLKRFPHLELLDRGPDWQANLSVRSLNHLNVALH